MDDLDRIGQWLQRETEAEGAVLTKGHRVETRVADRFYTHCGRAFGPREGTILVFFEFLPPEDRCLRC